MLKNLALTLAAGGVVAMSTAFPYPSLLVTPWAPQHEPQAMLLLATCLFGAASVVRRIGKPPRRRH